jgi:hypothetical protein
MYYSVSYWRGFYQMCYEGNPWERDDIWVGHFWEPFTTTLQERFGVFGVPQLLTFVYKFQIDSCLFYFPQFILRHFKSS